MSSCCLVEGKSLDKKMKVIILAAGYGTRMQKDIADQERSNPDGYQQYKHLLGIPKPLLPLSQLPLIDYWIQSIDCLNQKLQKTLISKERDVFVVTNNVFYPQFQEWCQKSHFPLENVLNDGTGSNNDRLGAIADIQFAISHYRREQQEEEDLMIIGGDTLFSDCFHSDMLSRIMTKEGFSSQECKRPVLLYYTLSPLVNISEKGIIEVAPMEDLENNDELTPMKVVKFLEKPKPHETESRLASPCFYLLDKASVPLVQSFLDQINIDATTSSNDSVVTVDNSYLRDAPGHFVRYLTQVQPTIACYQIEQRFDVGHLNEYIETDEYWKNHHIDTSSH